MNISSSLIIGGYISFIINLSIGLFVYFRNRKDSVNILFCLFSFTIAFWSVGSSLVNSIANKNKAILMLRFCYLFAAFLPSIYLNFIFFITGQRANIKRVVFILYLFSLILSPFVFTDLFIKGVRFMEPHLFLISIPGPLYYAFIIFFGIGTFLGLNALYAAIKNSVGYKHNQLKYLFGAQIVALLAGYEYFSSVLGIKHFPPLDDYILVIYFIVMAIAILKYRLLDINIALTRAGIFILVYFPVVFIPFWIAPRFIHTNLWWIPILLMGILATLGIFIYNSLRRQAENRYLAEDLRKYGILKRFTATLGRMRDIDLLKLLKLIVYRLVKTMEISYGAIYLNDEDANTSIKKASYNSKGKGGIVVLEELSPESAFIRCIAVQRKEFLLEDVQRLASEVKPRNNSHSANGINYSEVITQMRQLNARLVIPSFLDKELIGFLVLGEKASGKPYSPADIEVLVTLSRSASLAILNALFAIKVSSRERELADALRIVEIGNLASATGHQLGNVLNNIMNAGYGILDNDTILDSLKDNPQAKGALEKIINIIITNASDGDQIIEEIRSYSRQEGDRQFSLVNLKDVLDKTLNMLYIQINKFQNIDINITIGPDAPVVLGSAIGLQNIFVNMLNNSYDSIQEMKEHIRLHPESGINGYKGRIEVTMNRLKGNVDIHIIDNGKGMTPDIAKKLFAPHYTTKGSSDKRKEIKLSGGTGIGLFTIRFLAKDYGGTVKLFRTEPLRGADFLIQLPVPRG